MSSLSWRRLASPESVLSLGVSGLLPGSGGSSRADVILYAFDWSDADIAKQAAAIAAAGYKAVLMTPPIKTLMRSGPVRQGDLCRLQRLHQPQQQLTLHSALTSCPGHHH